MTTSFASRVTRGRVLAVLPFVLYPLSALARGQFRWDHAAVMIGFLVFAFGGPRLGKIFAGAYPIGLVGLLYDGMKPLRNLGLSEDRVHICDMRAADMALFTMPGPTGRVSISDWFQAHHVLGLDVLCALPYGTFIFVVIAFAVFAFRRDLRTMLRFGWAFFALNLAGFLTYHIFPAGPPWYYHAHGCVADLASRASEGPGLARVDSLLGFPYFQGLYGRSSDVFGAMPSLHVAYALIVAIEGYALFGKPLRAAAITFFVWMCFSAVYLDHHWVVDVLAGITYTIVVAASTRLIFRALDRYFPTNPAPATAEPPRESAAVLS